MPYLNLESNHMRQRITYFDFLRGIAILMVVGIHTFSHSTFDSIGGNITIIIRQVINCAVPIFLAISGFFLAQKKLDTKADCLKFWKKQIPAVYVPCFIWSLPLFVVAILHPGSNILVNIAKLCFCGFSIYYFVILIIQLYILLPFLKKFNIRHVLFASATISGAAAIMTTYLLAIKGYDIPLTVYGGPFPLLIFYFVLGMYLANSDRNYKLTVPIIMALAGIALQYFEAKFLVEFHGVGFGNKFSFMPYSAAMIILLFSNRAEQWYEHRTKQLQIFQRLGGISYGMYLTHCYVILILSHIHTYIPWIINWLLVVTITAIMIFVVKKITPSFSTKYLGFR